MEEKYNQFNNIVNRLFILDKDDVMTVILAPMRSDISVGADFSFRDWMKETRSSQRPVFSDGFWENGNLQNFHNISYNEHSQRWIHWIVRYIHTYCTVFCSLGKVGNINSQFLVAYNKNATLLVNDASQDLVGEYFFGGEAQKFINHNEILNNSMRRLLLASNSDYAVHDYGKGERLTTDIQFLLMLSLNIFFR